MKLEPDGSGQIITGAQECGTGAVMTLRQLAADELGMQPEDFQIVYQDTSVGPFDLARRVRRPCSTTAAPCRAASQQIADQLKNLAADHFEARPATSCSPTAVLMWRAPHRPLRHGRRARRYGDGWAICSSATAPVRRTTRRR